MREYLARIIIPAAVGTVFELAGIAASAFILQRTGLRFFDAALLCSVWVLLAKQNIVLARQAR